MYYVFNVFCYFAVNISNYNVNGRIVGEGSIWNDKKGKCRGIMEALFRNLPELSFHNHESLLCPQHSSRDSKQHFRHIVQSAHDALKWSITYVVINSSTCSSLGHTNIFKLFRGRKWSNGILALGQGSLEKAMKWAYLYSVVWSYSQNSKVEHDWRQCALKKYFFLNWAFWMRYS